MRPGAGFGVALAALVHLSAQVSAQSPDDSLQIYAVKIVRTPPFQRQITGDGIYLGHGLVITAAHIVGRWPFFTHPRVLIAGQDLPAKVIREGSFPKVDLALLSVDGHLLPISVRLRRAPLCRNPSPVGTPVIDVAPQELTPAKIISPLLIAPRLQEKFNSLISAPQGSGSGLFDSDLKCLVGIMSGEVKKFHYQSENGHVVWTANGMAGYFVPAATIANFIPSNIRF